MTHGPRRAFLAGAGGALGAAALARAATAHAAAGEVPLLSYVAGTGYGTAPAHARRLRPGTTLVLRRRPDSAYDPRTVEVWTEDGARLGQVPRIDNQALARLMDAGFATSARVTRVAAGGRKPEIRLDVSLLLGA